MKYFNEVFSYVFQIHNSSKKNVNTFLYVFNKIQTNDLLLGSSILKTIIKKTALCCYDRVQNYDGKISIYKINMHLQKVHGR